MVRRLLAGVAVVLVCAPDRAPAAPCPVNCKTLSCHLKAARCLLEGNKAEAVKEQLRPLLAEHPDSVELHLLLARAYLDLDNSVWARRVLYQGAQNKENDCQLRAWLVWVHLGKAELDLAKELLDQAGCPGQDKSTKARWHLLRGTLARHRKQQEGAEQQLEAATTMPALFAEDHDLMAWLRRYARPNTGPPPVQLRTDLGMGYTSNGVMSSPADPSAPGAQLQTGTQVLTLDLMANFEPPWGQRLRPVLEAGVRGLVLFDKAVKDFTYFNLTLRPGIALPHRGLRAYYRAQLFLLTGGDRYDPDGPRTFYETHRGELEWTATPWLSLWAGGGRSIFREQPRSRTEIDGGAGFTLQPWRLRLLTALSLRGHLAHHDAYDLFGATALGSATLPLGRFALRGRLVLSLDMFPSSTGYFDAQRNRRDMLIKGGVEGWSPTWHGLRVGVSYEVSHRHSSAELYTYTDHRVLGRLRWRLGWNPWAPGTADPPAHHVRLPYKVSGGGGGLEDERIQDLLRQEDAAQRGSSCID